MLVPLSVTLHPLRAHIDAGVLVEHGIPAWVWGDVTSCSNGTVTTGGCRVMVDEENLAEAEEVLQAVPATPEGPSPLAEPEVEKVVPPLAMKNALGAGVVSGALFLPLVLIALTLITALVAVIQSAMFQGGPLPARFLTGVGHMLMPFALPGMIYGALWGAFGGLVAWLIRDYKRHGTAGRWFVVLMIGLMAVIALLI